MNKKENLTFMIGFALVTIFLSCVIFCTSTAPEENSEVVTVVTEAEDVLSASNYQPKPLNSVYNMQMCMQ